MPTATNGNGGGGNQRRVREQDRFMPIANVIRIMRKVLPPHAKISDDAKETIQECVSEYISFITSEANDRCQREQRKTVTAEDLLWAMSKLGFDDYIGPLTSFLLRYRELEGDHRGSVRGDPLPPFKLPASAANLAVPPLQQPPPQNGAAVVDSNGHNFHHHHQAFGVYGEQVMAGGYYFGMPGGGDGGGASNAAAAYDLYNAYK